MPVTAFPLGVGSEWHLGLLPLLVRGLHLRELQEDALRGAAAPLWGWAFWGMCAGTGGHIRGDPARMGVIYMHASPCSFMALASHSSLLISLSTLGSTLTPLNPLVSFQVSGIPAISNRGNFWQVLFLPYFPLGWLGNGTFSLRF